MEELSHRIKQKRSELNLTQAQLAGMIGVKQQSIQLIESGKTRRPRLLLELASALKCDASWLMFGKKGHHAA